MDSTLRTAPTGYRRLLLGGNTCVYIADILGPFILICYQIINMFIISYLVKSSGILYQVARASMFYNLVTTITRIVNYRVDVWASRLASSLLLSERARTHLSRELFTTPICNLFWYHLIDEFQQ